MSTGVVIRLKNLPNSAGTTDIRRFFGGLSIPDGGVHIIGGEDGTAFILFSTDEDARQAMLRDSQKITGEKIKLMLSSHTEMRTMIEESQRKYEELRGLRPPEPPITNLTSKSSATGGNSVAKSQSLEVDANDLYVELKGMPENVTEEELVEFFRNLPISAIRLLLDEEGQQTGLGFVRFRSPSSKLAALKKDRDFLGPRFVRVLPATEKQWVVASSQMCEVWRPNSDHQSRKRGSNNTPSNEGTPKRSRAFSPIRYENCVELRGLPPSATEKTVQELFYHLKFAENGLYIESDGKACRGRAFAEFTSIDDYKEALLKDGEIMEEKQIRVINISRQGMAECIKHNKKYLKMKRDEEYKRERDEMERKAREKRQQKEAHERQQQQLEEQKRSEEEQRKRREHHLKKQKEMEEWLARQHEKEEAERKRQEVEKRMEEQRRIRAAEEDRIRREEERRRQQEEEQIRREEEEERRRREYERKRQRELDEIELRIKEEEKRRIQEELLKEELESMNNGNAKEVEMDLESPPKTDELSDHYPPPPSDALLPANSLPRYSVASSNKDSDYSSYNRSPMGEQIRPEDQIMSPYVSVPYSRGRSPPPIPSTAHDRPPPLPPHTIPRIPPPLPTAIVGASQPPRIPPTIPPPPLPPAIPVLRIPPRPQIVVRDPLYPPPVPTVKPPLPVVPVVPGNIVPGPAIPPPGVVLPPPSPVPPSDAAMGNNHSAPSVFCRVANVPFSAEEMQLREFFKGCQIVPNGVEFLMKHGKNSGHVFVKFATEKDAAEAAKLDQMSFGGREILVRLTHAAQMSEILRKFGSRKLNELFPNKMQKHDNLDLERDIYHERMTCVRIANLPLNTIVEDILRAFSGIGIMPNGVHILKMADGKCNGSAFVEVITPEDCVRATNLHAVASVQGSLIRVMPLKHQEMDREIIDHNATVFGRFPPGPPPGVPHHLPPVRGRIPVPPPPIPTPPGMRHPPPIRPEHEMMQRHPDHHPPLRPPLPPRGRSPPPHMKNHRPNSPNRGPPLPRPRSPPRAPSGRPISPPMRPRSPREMSREEMAQRANMDQLNRRIEMERSKMRDMHPPGPYGDHFPIPGPRPHFDRPGERPHLPPGLPPRFPPRFMGDGPWHTRHPLDMPRFRMPHGTAALKMSNLSFHITQEDILEFFMKFSPLPDSVRLMYNPSGKLTGEGFIAFPSHESADRALRELDQKPLLQRKIKLNIA